jgi:aminomethyltransferase
VSTSPPKGDPAGAHAALSRTALHALHVELGAKMVPFAGYDMPVQYPAGILKEHLHARAQAVLFDVSHMGQARLNGAGALAALEALVPGDIEALGAGRIRYTMLTAADGGILDDIMVTKGEDSLGLVLNAARKDADCAHIGAALGPDVSLERLDRFAPEAPEMRFLEARALTLAGTAVTISRAGYTGEDGFEISVTNEAAEGLARTLLAEDEVAPAGLGARDTLRLEAGLCLYGHDIDETTTPVEADLAWTISKRRRAEGGFPGAERILGQLADGTERRRVGILPDGRAPAREGTEIFDTQGAPIGRITSGGFGPSVGGPIAMGYVASAFAETGSRVILKVREREVPARIHDLPFVPHRYYRPTS